jgi:hypothetical protein
MNPKRLRSSQISLTPGSARRLVNSAWPSGGMGKIVA